MADQFTSLLDRRELRKKKKKIHQYRGTMTQAQICRGDQNNTTIFSIPMTSFTSKETEQVIYKVELGHPAHGEISALEDIQYEEKLFDLPLASVKRMASLIIPPKRGRKRKTGDDLKCDICGKHRKALLRHKKIHKPTRDYQCQYCWREYCQKYELQRHSKVCKFKDNRLQEKCDLEKVITEVTEIESRKIDEEKEEDNQDLPLNQDLNDEEKLEDNQESSKTQKSNEKSSKRLVKPYLCSICGKQFNSKGNLKHHFITHNYTGGFLCEVCGKRFHHQSTLDSHVRIQHKGESPYQCSICNKMYTSSASLNNHFRVHFDDRPFACKICKKTFKVKRALHRHMNIHVQDSPLTNCEFCGKPCVDRGAKITHYKLHFNRLFQKAEVKKTNTESGAEQIQILHSILKNNRGLIKNPKCENNPCKLTYKEQWNKSQESMFKEIVEVLGAEKKNFNTPLKLKDIPKIGIIQKDVYIEKPIMKRPPKKMKKTHNRTAEIVNDENHTEDINNSGCHGNSAINTLEKITSKNSDVSPNSKTSENSLNEKKDGVMKKNLSEIKLTHIKQEADENNKASSVNMDKCHLSENISIENGSKGDNKFEIYDFIKKIDETTLQIKDDKAVNPIIEYSNNISKNCFETNEENSSENVETIIMGDSSSELKVSDIGSLKVDSSFEMAMVINLQKMFYQWNIIQT
ncbi:KRAB [Mytilus coruscus]|uniref:KRAB n=1 Tax=Mytilus coruscus TaxID=42192 RepID=A0A6J8AK99_MYTCO|nr:KRAB [Mytilus coruscus]